MRKKRMTKADLAICGIQPRYHSSTLDDFKGGSVAKAIVTKYMENITMWRRRGVGLFITGQGRADKSMIANLVALSALACDFSVRVYSLSRLTSFKFDQSDKDFRASGTSTNLDDKTYYQIIDTEFLVIDDLCDTLKPFYPIRAHTLYDIVKHRQACMLPTLMTTRLPLEGRQDSVESVFGDAIKDVVQETTIYVDCIPISQADRERRLPEVFDA